MSLSQNGQAWRLQGQRRCVSRGLVKGSVSALNAPMKEHTVPPGGRVRTRAASGLGRAPHLAHPCEEFAALDIAVAVHVKD